MYACCAWPCIFLILALFAWLSRLTSNIFCHYKLLWRSLNEPGYHHRTCSPLLIRVLWNCVSCLQGMQVLELPVVEFYEISLNWTLQQVQVPLKSSTIICYISHCSQFHVIFKLAYSVPSSKSLMKKFNNIGLSISIWGIPLVTFLQMDLLPLITTLWPQLFG